MNKLMGRGDVAAMTHSIGGLEFQPTGPNEAAEYIVELARGRRSAHIHLANAYTIALPDRDDNYRQFTNEGLVFADGMPITWFSRLFRNNPPCIQRVRGPQPFLGVLDIGRPSGLRHFLLGSTDETHERMRVRLASRFEGLDIVGSYSPFRPLTAEEVALIRDSGADIVWIGLGTPKQDVEAARLASAPKRLWRRYLFGNVRFICAVLRRHRVQRHV